jgi:hypothetical protein
MAVSEGAGGGRLLQRKIAMVAADCYKRQSDFLDFRFREN